MIYGKLELSESFCLILKQFNHASLIMIHISARFFSLNMQKNSGSKKTHCFNKKINVREKSTNYIKIQSFQFMEQEDFFGETVTEDYFIERILK